jgi:hypothetical protein
MKRDRHKNSGNTGHLSQTGRGNSIADTEEKTVKVCSYVHKLIESVNTWK